MDLRACAERILFGATLEDKLVSPVGLSDARPGAAIAVPSLPHRPEGLRLDDARPRKKFPGLTPDGDPRLRGRVLHYFANHELLAIELMALFLLRFPDAPAAFRRAIAHTISEEQTHLGLYRQRMADFGVSLGAVPVSRFFWDTLAEMNGPLEYLSGMSLTFEQANLDFSRHYMRRFREIGDEATARLLRQVYDDEIGHVKLGVVWFEKLREPTDRRPFWDRYRAALRPPLTPARARGLGFDEGARRAAGLSTDYIEALQGFSHSKGRTPDLYLFNPAAEMHLAHGHVVELPRAVDGLAQDLAALPMYLAGADDAVLVPRVPRAAFLAHLRDADVDIPQFVTPPELADANRVFARLWPWAWSPDSRAALAPCLQRQPALDPSPRPRHIFEKRWAVDLARQWSATEEVPWGAPSMTVGTAYTAQDEAMDAVSDLYDRGGAVVNKAPLGSAGRGMIRVLSTTDLPRAAAWIARVLQAQGAVVVEPWLDRVLDLSVQIFIDDDGRVRVSGVTRFETDDRGQYMGTWVGRPLHELEEELRRFLIGPGRGWRVFAHLEAVGRFVGAALAAEGHRGPAGVDALVYRDPVNGLRLKPIVEVNPRFTMGHLALRLGKRLGNRRTGCFRIITAAQAKRAGMSSLSAYVASMGERFLCLTDPTDAKHAVAVLETGPPLRRRG